MQSGQDSVRAASQSANPRAQPSIKIKPTLIIWLKSLILCVYEEKLYSDNASWCLKTCSFVVISEAI